MLDLVNEAARCTRASVFDVVDPDNNYHSIQLKRTDKWGKRYRFLPIDSLLPANCITTRYAAKGFDVTYLVCKTAAELTHMSGSTVLRTDQLTGIDFRTCNNDNCKKRECDCATTGKSGKLSHIAAETRIRQFSLEELYKLMDFRDNEKIMDSFFQSHEVSKTFRSAALGNSVVVGVIELLMEQIMNCLQLEYVPNPFTLKSREDARQKYPNKFKKVLKKVGDGPEGYHVYSFKPT